MNIKKWLDVWKYIHIRDKWLIIIMVVLYAQIGYTLFLPDTTSIVNNSIDIVIRTSSAGIFGYLLSGSFLAGNKNIRDVFNNVDTKVVAEKVEKYTLDILEEMRPKLDEKKSISQSNLQIIVASIMAIIAFGILIVARNVVDMSASSAASLSQIRDFFVCSIGFLIGHNIEN